MSTRDERRAATRVDRPRVLHARAVAAGTADEVTPALRRLFERSAVTLVTPRLLLALPPPELAPAYLRYCQDNRDHLAPWEPPREEGFWTEEFWRTRLERSRAELHAGSSLRLALFARSSEQQEPALAFAGPVIGHANFNQFVRGAFQACTLGYSLDQRHVGRGLMEEALRVALRHVFGPLGFHRVMANYMPINERSGRLLRRLGFSVEGYARDYLFIDGAWRDHVLTALTNPDARYAPEAR
ncbi:MAG: GNAT family N-acetyltransferase [Polyangiaceae bacterium]